MIARLLRKADFERLLALPARSRSAHFALHHLRTGPGRPMVSKLYTSDAPLVEESVDNNPSSLWIGSVIPKRHAVRAVTRNLLRRQIRAALLRHESRLPGGLWLVRLRSPFGKAQFVSAGSTGLRAAAAAELDRLLMRAEQ